MNTILVREQSDRYRLAPTDPRARHLKRVLRVSSGDTVRIAVLGGPLGEATVIENGAGGFDLTPVWRETPLPSLPITVLVGHPRPPVLRRLWRDLAAMRVARVEVFAAELSERSYLTSSVWEHVDDAIADGLSQGGHSTPPTVTSRRSLRDALVSIRATDPDGPDTAGPDTAGARRFFGSLAAADTPGLLTLPEALSSIAARSAAVTESGVVVAVGPERGFTAAEEASLVAAGFCGVRLGRSILRTETATILLAGAACAAVATGGHSA